MLLKLILLFLPLILFAIDGEVRLEIEKKERYLVSEKIIVKLHVMTTGFSINNIKVDSSSNKEFVVLAPQSASYVLSEEYKEQSWQSSVYEYAFYPLKSGNVKLKPLSVSFNASQGYGQPVASFSKQTTPIELEVQSPQGIKNFVLSTPSLKLDVVYEPELSSVFKVGDSFSRTIRQSAKNVPDLLLYPLKLATIEGLGVYESEAGLSQTSDIASRVDRVDIVMKKAGDYTLGAQTIYWYDSQNDTLHKEKIEAVSFRVIAPSKPMEVKEERIDYKIILLSLLLFIVFIFVILKIVRYERTYIRSLPKDMNPKSLAINC
jgi:hypothetical protein